MSFVRSAAFAAGGLLFSAATAFAGPAYLFSVSTGDQPSNVGAITLSQEGVNSVKVLVDLADTSLPLPEYGFINSGTPGDSAGPHTPFAFTLGGGTGDPESGISVAFIQPAGGIYDFRVFTLSTSNGNADPFGTYGISINSSAGNGTSNAYFGDLEFIVTRAGGLSIDDFITNASLGAGSSGPAYFAADLTDGGSKTGEQAWLTRIACASDDCGPEKRGADVPEPASFALFGTALVGLGLLNRRRQNAVQSDGDERALLS